MPRRINLALLACAIVLPTFAAHASPLPPCIRSTLSANANVLVLNDLTFDDPDETHPRPVQTSTFRIFTRYSERNEPLRLNGPDSYWAHELWKVTLNREDKATFAICPYVLVTDDGEYLILLGDYPGRSALSIYRRRDHPGLPYNGTNDGQLIRQVPLADLWPRENLPDGFMSGDPLWFAKGTFSFLPDNRTLIHTTRWGKTFQIDLQTGEVLPGESKPPLTNPAPQHPR